MSRRSQVIIVGGGPVGVGLAIDLGLRGISVTLIERRTTLSNIPKGQNLTQRTIEHFHFWGVADAIRAARIMPPGSAIGEITAYGDLMSEYWASPKGRETAKDYFFQPNDRLPQYRTEAVLRRRMGELPEIESLFGWRATQVEEGVDGVRVSIENEESGETETLEGDYVVGCDGGHSMVRETIGVGRTGTDYDQLMVLAVFRSRALHEGLKRFPVRSHYRVMDPALKGFWLFLGRIDVGESWFFHAPVPAGTTRENVDFKGLIERTAGFEFEAEFDHVGFWDLRIAFAETYRKGRIFIAGDAAHSHPPYGGFGLNTGLEDAANLGWKLAAKLQRWGGEALLDSYSAERQPVFRDTAEGFIESQMNEEREFLARYSPEKDRAEFEAAWNARDNIVPWAAGYEPRYGASPVVFGADGDETRARGEHMYRARAGHHLAPAPLSDGRDVFDALPRDFTLLAFDAADTDVAALEAAAAALAIPFSTVRDSLDGGRKRYEARLVLVRPDQYVAWSGDALDGDATVILKRAAGLD